LTKIYKIVIFKRLKEKFPEIKEIRKDRSKKFLFISSVSPYYIQKNIYDSNIVENVCRIVCLKIASQNPKDTAEPYTEETLQKAIDDYPILYAAQISELRKQPRFIDFVK
jgi:hypothetical protein